MDIITGFEPVGLGPIPSESTDKVEYLHMKEGKFIVSGRDKDVFEHPDSPERIVKKHRKELFSERKAVARGYLGMIMHILLPENIPAVHMSSARPNQVVAERADISGDADHAEIIKQYSPSVDQSKIGVMSHIDMLSRRAKRSKDPAVIKLKNKFDELGVQSDIGVQNFAKNKEGAMVYVETLDPWESTFAIPTSKDPKERLPIMASFDEAKLAKAIQQIPDEPTRKRAEIYLARLVDLFNEEAQFLLNSHKS